jgi:RNA polymerase sigma factor (sigma-70 family)
MHCHSTEAPVAQHGLTHLLRYLHRRSLGHAGGLPDSALLDRYVQARDEAAFELLVWRHGSLVLNLCRRILRNDHDVDDAFQATFATLAYKARTIRGQTSVAPWLYKVAYRAALAARGRSQRHVTLARAAEPLAVTEDDLLWRDLRGVLDAEVNQLSAKYRDVFVLCYLQGLTHAEAATRLNCPEGTVHSRLATAKERLRRSLERRGVTLSGTGMALEFATRQAALVPGVTLVQSTLTTVAMIAGESAVSTAVTSTAIALSRGVLFTMWMQSLAAPALVVITLGFAGAGVVGFQTKNTEQRVGGQAALQGQLTIENRAREILNDEKKKDPALGKEIPSKADLTDLQQHLAHASANFEMSHIEAMRKQTAIVEELSARLFATELQARAEEELSLMMLTRSKKKLSALEDEEISLSRDLRKLSANNSSKAKGQPEIEPLARQLQEVRKLIDHEYGRIKETQDGQKKVEQKAHKERNELQRMVQFEERKLMQLAAQYERFSDYLQEKLNAVELALKFPRLGNLINTNDDTPDIKRLETKLDQIMRELAAMKKQQAKP